MVCKPKQNLIPESKFFVPLFQLVEGSFVYLGISETEERECCRELLLVGGNAGLGRNHYSYFMPGF